MAWKRLRASAGVTRCTVQRHFREVERLFSGALIVAVEKACGLLADTGKSKGWVTVGYSSAS